MIDVHTKDTSDGYLWWATSLDCNMWARLAKLKPCLDLVWNHHSLIHYAVDLTGEYMGWEYLLQDEELVRKFICRKPPCGELFVQHMDNLLEQRWRASLRLAWLGAVMRLKKMVHLFFAQKKIYHDHVSKAVRLHPAGHKDSCALACTNTSEARGDLHVRPS